MQMLLFERTSKIYEKGIKISIRIKILKATHGIFRTDISHELSEDPTSKHIA